MQPVITAIGAVAIAAALQGLARQDAPSWAFWAASAAAACAGAALGRFVLARLAPPRFGRAATAATLGLHAAVVAAVPAGAAVANLLPAVVVYFAMAWATHGAAGRPFGFGRVEWAAPRLFLIPLAPFALVYAIEEAARLSPRAMAFLAAHPAAEIALGAAIVGALLAAGPPVLRHLFPARPLDGPAAESLAALAERAGVRFRAAFVWMTGARGIVNACVAGIAPRTRCVFVTDGLLGALGPQEVEAVLAHEVSHVRCRHFELLFLLVAGAFGAWSGLAPRIAGGDPGAELMFAVLWWGIFLLGPFAWVSRVLELEADLKALDLGIDPAALVRALDTLRVLAPPRRRGHSWRHFSIPYRIRMILDHIESPRARMRFRRLKRGIAGAIVALCAAGAALYATAGPRGAGDDTPLRVAHLLLGGARSDPGLCTRAEEAVEGYLAERGIPAEALAGAAGVTAAACPPERMRAVLEALSLLAEARAGLGKFPAWLPSFGIARGLAGGAGALPRLQAVAGARDAADVLREAEAELRAELENLQLGWDGLGWIDLRHESDAPAIARSLCALHVRYAGFKLLAELCAARGDRESSARADEKAAQCLLR
ncbi:MAG TPA: hypothetical protein DCM87_11375 [Planctomycetes bacterium]|nr:hypothetical protein [Planctomycetota bacterium]